MNCPHATAITAQVNACGLGLYGGRPSAGVCKLCVSRGENLHVRIEPQTPPRMSQMIKTASKAVTNFARSGFATTDPKTLASREATCRGCDMWDAQAVNGTGRCRKCGCATWAKLRMASEKCPLGKW
jgi:hypothetical protein